MRELTKLRDQVTVWENLSHRLNDALELVELDDEELRGELAKEVAVLGKQIADLEFQTLFSGQYDDEDCILAIHAGAGGTEAQDWAQMLERMFMRWADTHELVVDIVDESPGDEAGLKSVMMAVKGNYAYGRLQSERGVHRLVRISPYDSSSRRHTSFAKVEVWPDVAEDIEIDVDEKDLRIDRFKASGAGGQHVQKNETAVRITHIPSGIVVSCQNQRSLTQNREVAMKILKAQLFDLEQRKQEAEMAALKGEDVDAGWGSQIRSYVLHPYKMVKDHRTNFELGNAQAVLDGRLDDFMEAYLKQKVGQSIEPTP
ncbi:MAG: peptide chain release factor 2 [Ardenticatenaceae bacterium]|nr:MAG: peptide chain release factor 2 [Ardenticatenaceae bacterium]